MIISEITKLTNREKFQLMEALWDDLRKKADEYEVPKAHKDLLDARRHAVESGEDSILDWDRVKHSLQRP